MEFNNFDDLSALAQRVYLWLFMNQSDDDHRVTATYAQIAAGIKAKPTLTGAINNLVSAGYIKTTGKTTGQHQRTYKICYALTPVTEDYAGLIANKGEYLERVYTSDEVPTPTANAPSEHEIWGKL